MKLHRTISLIFEYELTNCADRQLYRQHPKLKYFKILNYLIIRRTKNFCYIFKLDTIIRQSPSSRRQCTFPSRGYLHEFIGVCAKMNILSQKTKGMKRPPASNPMLSLLWYEYTGTVAPAVGSTSARGCAHMSAVD